MNYHALLLALISIMLLDTSLAERPMQIEINNFTCVSYYPEIAHEFTCTLHRKRVVPSMSVRFNLKETAEAFNIICSWKIVTKGATFASTNITLDGCKVLSSFYGNNIVGKFFKHIRTFGNLPKSCPVPDNTLFEVRNYTVQAQEYPKNIPALTYEFDMQMEYKNRIVGDIYIRGKISY
ncbi:uncharacterized protein LOC127565393 [Drosophila albomicans]|uniref:Uncharacterized protein LOC127565393 n=1 Tax=Drosophila albomicans TaxID=7291 RepID=A0A9C6W4Z5_DROAB|nr:uncharacterized protein LOC127565393 [Drosophila albomicans]